MVRHFAMFIWIFLGSMIFREVFQSGASSGGLYLIGSFFGMVSMIILDFQT